MKSYIKQVLFILGISFFVEATQAAIYYVSTTGKDDGNEIGSKTSPFRTIAKGSRKLAPGDTLYIRKGTYIEGMEHNYGGFKFVNGTSKSKTRFAAYPGEEALAKGYTANDSGKVIIKPPKKAEGVTFVVWFSQNTEYIEISGLVLDAGPGGQLKFDHSYKDNIWAKNNRLINNEIRNGGGVGGGGGNEIIGNWIHHSEVYGIYTAIDNGRFEGNLVEDIRGHGIHLFQQNHQVNGWVIRNNIIRRTGGNYYPTSIGRTGKHRPLPAVVLARGSSQFYNNLVYDNPYGGVHLGLGAVDTLVANNTIYGNGKYGINLIAPQPGNGGSKNARVINNIVYGNNGNNGPQIDDKGANTTLQKNLTTDPKFVKAAAGDFRLQVGSPAINKGVRLPEVPFDFTKTRRPAGAYDIGAYEYGAAKTITLSAPTNLRVYGQ